MQHPLLEEAAPHGQQAPEKQHQLNGQPFGLREAVGLVLPDDAPPAAAGMQPQAPPRQDGKPKPEAAGEREDFPEGWSPWREWDLPPSIRDWGSDSGKRWALFSRTMRRQRRRKCSRFSAMAFRGERFSCPARPFPGRAPYKETL